MSGGSPDGVAGITAEADQAKAGGNGCCCAPAGPGGDAIQSVRILRVAGEDGAYGLIRSEGPFREIGFCEDNGPGFADAPDLKRIFRREETFQREGSIGGLQTFCLEVVLNDDGDAVQGPVGPDRA
jgi:hypothetical protein